MLFSLQKNVGLFMQYLFLGSRLDLSFGGLIYGMHQTLSMNDDKGHIFMYFDGMI